MLEQEKKKMKKSGGRGSQVADHIRRWELMQVRERRNE
jgi:hypothetical protein